MKIDINIKYSKKKYIKLNFLCVRVLRQVRKKAKIDQKVFCVGFGKTGTTSLGQALKSFGYRMNDQVVGEILAEDWADKRIDRIIKFCYTADAFQDMPYGLPDLYKEIDNVFSGSKFILTIRKDENVWFESLIKFHSKIFASEKSNIPTFDDLAFSEYRYRGWALDMIKKFWNYPKTDLYNEQYYKKKYLQHVNDVIEYFKDRPDDLLVLNVGAEGSYQKLAAFLGIKVSSKENFPWLNKT